MKYYCIGNSIAIVKTTYSDKLFDNLPITGTLMFGKLPVTQTKMETTFNDTNELVICKTLDDAMKIRTAKIEPLNIKADYIQGAIAEGYPLVDYAIYEIDVDDNITIDFTDLKTMKDDQIRKIVNSNLHFMAVHEKDYSNLPEVAVCLVNKNMLNPTLLSSHYFSPIDNQEEVENTTSCRII